MHYVLIRKEHPDVEIARKESMVSAQLELENLLENLDELSPGAWSASDFEIVMRSEGGAI